jgi:pyrroloquinoline quinone biosynthesis protein D
VSGPRLTAKARLRWDAREERYLLLYPERGLALSETAAAILKRCDGIRSLEGIVDALAEGRPDGDYAMIRHDVVAFLEEMRRRGLVEGC